MLLRAVVHPVILRERAKRATKGSRVHAPAPMPALARVYRPHVRQFYVYVLASTSHVLYVGVTNDLRRRVHEHRTAASGFTARYRIRHLVYFEVTASPLAAIAREKELKRWPRKKKVALIEAANPRWEDLARRW